MEDLVLAHGLASFWFCDPSDRGRRKQGRGHEAARHTPNTGATRSGANGSGRGLTGCQHRRDSAHAPSAGGAASSGPEQGRNHPVASDHPVRSGGIQHRQQHPPLREADAAAHPAVRQRLEKVDQIACSGRSGGIGGGKRSGAAPEHDTVGAEPRQAYWDGLLIGPVPAPSPAVA